MGFWDRAQTKPWRAEHDDSDEQAYTADQIVAYAEDDFREQQQAEDEMGTGRVAQWYNGRAPRQLDGDDLDEYLYELRDHPDHDAIRDAAADRLGLG